MNDLTKFVVIAEEFPPKHGGVAAFARDICLALWESERLIECINLDPQQATNFSFPCNALKMPRRNPLKFPGDSWPPTRKVITAAFYLHRRWEYAVSRTLDKRLAKLREEHGDFAVWCTYTVHQPDIITKLLIPQGYRYWILFHGLDLIGAKQMGAAVQPWVDNAERIIFNSKATQALFVDLGYKITVESDVCYPGVRASDLLCMATKCKELLYEKHPQLRQYKHIIASVGRLVRRKGIDLVIHAFAKLKENRDIVYCIAGDGPELHNLRGLASKLGVDDRVLFLGPVSEELKVSLLSHSTIFAMPNRSLEGTDFEGFGIVFAEASLLGCIPIGGRHGGACEAVVDGSTGWLIDTETDRTAIDESAKLIRELLENEPRRRSVAIAGRELVLTRFDNQRSIINCAGNACGSSTSVQKQ